MLALHLTVSWLGLSIYVAVHLVAAMWLFCSPPTFYLRARNSYVLVAVWCRLKHVSACKLKRACILDLWVDKKKFWRKKIILQVSRLYFWFEGCGTSSMSMVFQTLVNIWKDVPSCTVRRYWRSLSLSSSDFDLWLFSRCGHTLHDVSSISASFTLYKWFTYITRVCGHIQTYCLIVLLRTPFLINNFFLVAGCIDFDVTVQMRLVW